MQQERSASSAFRTGSGASVRTADGLHRTFASFLALFFTDFPADPRVTALARSRIRVFHLEYDSGAPPLELRYESLWTARVRGNHHVGLSCGIMTNKVPTADLRAL